MGLFLALILFLSFPAGVNAKANIPLFHQLLFAYHSNSLTYSITTPASDFIASTPAASADVIWKNNLTTPVGQILGASTTNNLPAIGGQGRIITIAVLGDSMIDTLQPGLPQLKSALGRYYPSTKFNILNYGVGGRNIEFGLYRLNHDYNYLNQEIKSLISQNPDIVVVESFAYNNFGNSSQGIDRHWLNLGAITTTIKEKLPQAKIVLAATIAPNSVIFGNGIKDLRFTAVEKIEKSSTIRLYLQNLVNFATSQNYPLADAYHPSLINNEGNPKYINSGDSLHPSGPGGELFCNIVAKTIFDNHLIN